MIDKVNKVVYIVMGRKAPSLGQRFQKMLDLRRHYAKVVPVFVGPAVTGDESEIAVRPLPNPTGVLRVLRLHRLKALLDKYLFFPSTGALYFGRMTRELEKRIADDVRLGFEVCVIINMPPHATGTVGLRLKRRFPQIHWVMDWTDLWTYDENYLTRTPPLYRRRVIALERELLDKSDMNVTTNAIAADVLVRRYGVPANRVTWINHAFSAGDAPAGVSAMPRTLAEVDDDEIRIVFFGTLFKPPKVPGDRVVEAIRRLRHAGMNVVLHNYGMIPKAFLNSVSTGDGVVYHGMVDYKEGLKAIAQCHFQLLVLADLPNCRAVMNIKLPDYFLVNRPIIAIVPRPSAIAAVIEETNSGYVLPAERDWGEEMEGLMKRLANGASLPVRNEEAIRRYDWTSISAQWRDVIEGRESVHPQSGSLH